MILNKFKQVITYKIKKIKIILKNNKVIIINIPVTAFIIIQSTLITFNSRSTTQKFFFMLQKQLVTKARFQYEEKSRIIKNKKLNTGTPDMNCGAIRFGRNFIRYGSRRTGADSGFKSSI